MIWIPISILKLKCLHFDAIGEIDSDRWKIAWWTVALPGVEDAPVYPHTHPSILQAIWYSNQLPAPINRMRVHGISLPQYVGLLMISQNIPSLPLIDFVKFRTGIIEIRSLCRNEIENYSGRKCLRRYEMSSILLVFDHIYYGKMECHNWTFSACLLPNGMLWAFLCIKTSDFDISFFLSKITAIKWFKCMKFSPPTENHTTKLMAEIYHQSNDLIWHFV